MKTAVVLTVVSTLLFPRAIMASDTHDVDRSLESTLRTEINDKHVHFHVHEGIVTIDGKVRTDVDRNRIESVVRNTAGVVAMKDMLKVTLPAPGVYGAPPAGETVAPTALAPTTIVPAAVPVYVRPLPDLVPATPVVTAPAPVIIPNYPKLKVQAWSLADQYMANRVADQLSADAVPTEGINDVTIVVRGLNVSLKGSVDSHEDRDAIISSLQHLHGLSAIYDQLHIK